MTSNIKKLGLTSLVFLLIPSLISSFAPPISNEIDLEIGLFHEKFNLPDIEERFNFTKTKTGVPSRSVIPSYYRISIRPYFDPVETPEDRFKAPGSVIIFVDCVEDTKTITLNTNLIDVKADSVKVTSREAYRETRVLSQTSDTSKYTYTLELEESLKAEHEYEIRMDFVSRVLRDRLFGLYLSNYTDPTTNEMKYLATTQFEPYGARLLFPGFDEPDLKAIFDISVGRREKYNTLSNMNIFKTEPIENTEGWYWDHYNSTVKMSTYLIAVIVSEFTSETADSSLFGGKAVKVWGPKHKIDNKGGVYAAETVARILQYYEEYFQVKYPLPKMDSAEIPHFQSGAMENYAINTYREDYLLYFPKVSTELLRYQITTVIAHELGHQFFGNYVTTKTWPHIWLNEGFASYVEELGVAASYPEFNNWNLFSPNVLQIAFQFDQSPASHPIVDESKSLFDRITYKKGASLIRMMRSFLGEDTFRAGLQNYLEKFSFGNAFQSDLFDAIQETADAKGTFSKYTKLAEIMETWTLQKGYPLVRVSLADTNRIYLTQERFVEKNLLKANTKEEEDVGKDLWWVPIKMATNLNPEIKEGVDFWIPKQVGTYLKSNVDTSGLLLVNPNADGYYRVLYDATLAKRIKEQLESDHEVLTSNKRSQLIDDYFNFAASDYAPIEAPLEFTTYLANESELGVWTTTFKHLLKAYNLFSLKDGFTGFKNYLLPKVSAALSRAGIESKEEERGSPVLLRSRLFEWACALEDQACLKHSAEVFQNWVENRERNFLPTEVRSSVLCAAVAQIGESAWTTVYQKFKSEKRGTLKSALLRSLTCSKSVETLDRFLELALDSESGIEKSDVPSVIQYIISNSVGRESAFSFLQKKLPKIAEYLGGVKSLTVVLDTISKYFYRPSDFEKYVAEHETLLEPLGKQVNATLAAIRLNEAWLNKYYAPMTAWFDLQNSKN